MHANSLFAKTTVHQTGGFGPGCGQAGYGRDHAIVLVLPFPGRAGDIWIATILIDRNEPSANNPGRPRKERNC